MTTLTDKMITSEVDVPGMHPYVGVHGYFVDIRGNRHGRPFHRELRFPPETDMLNLHARLAEGVLTISAPYGTGRCEPAEHEIEVRPGIWACHPDAAPL
jgi:HSP20 family molecular chaperone IbpA